MHFPTHLLYILICFIVFFSGFIIFSLTNFFSLQTAFFLLFGCCIASRDGDDCDPNKKNYRAPITFILFGFKTALKLFRKIIFILLNQLLLIANIFAIFRDIVLNFETTIHIRISGYFL